MTGRSGGATRCAAGMIDAATVVSGWFRAGVPLPTAASQGLSRASEKEHDRLLTGLEVGRTVAEQRTFEYADRPVRQSKRRGGAGCHDHPIRRAQPARLKALAASVERHTCPFLVTDRGCASRGRLFVCHVGPGRLPGQVDATPSRSPPGPSTTWRWRIRLDRVRHPAPTGTTCAGGAGCFAWMEEPLQRRPNRRSETGAQRVPCPPMSEQLRLLSIHAHPDDEASKGASTVARYVAEGVRAVLVCCTGGEAGDILNPAMDRPEVRERLGEVRTAELAASVEAIGYHELVMLGYRDSGMPDTPENADPRCFARADIDEAVGRLVEVIRRERPHVILTYGDDQEGYPHPDHLRVHEISIPAFDRAGDASAYPEAGEPWQPLKLYYSAWARARIEAMHAKFGELGLVSPFEERWFERPSQDDRLTTHVAVGDFYDVRVRALRAHATQIDPTSPFWFGLPADVAATVHPWEDYILATSLVTSELPEDDLFAGIREPAIV